MILDVTYRVFSSTLYIFLLLHLIVKEEKCLMLHWGLPCLLNALIYFSIISNRFEFRLKN